MFSLSFILSFLSGLKKYLTPTNILIGILAIAVLVLGLYSCERNKQIEKITHEKDDTKNLLLLQKGKLSTIKKEKDGTTSTTTTVLGFLTMDGFKEALKESDIKWEGRLNKVLAAQKSITVTQLPSMQQTGVLKKDTVGFKIYNADSTNKHFSINEEIIVNTDSIGRVTGTKIKRNKIEIYDSTTQILYFGKLSKRILRLPFLKFDGIGVGGQKSIESKITHSNPYVMTTDAKIIVNRKKISKK